jgi:hypothetical protein
MPQIDHEIIERVKIQYQDTEFTNKYNITDIRIN